MKTLVMAVTFWDSENPTMLSGEMSLMNGNSEACAIEAPRAVLPDPGGP